MIELLRPSCVLIIAALFATSAEAHQGPDPVAHWSFNPRNVVDGVVKASLGPAIKLPTGAKVVADGPGHALDMTGDGSAWATSAPVESKELPRESLTVAAWVSIDEAEAEGGVIGTVGSEGQSGWRLGYDDKAFTFRLRTGDGETVLVGTRPYSKGRWFHVVGVYDGERAELYVNGKLDAEARVSGGDLQYGDETRYVLGSTGGPSGASLRGRLWEVSVYDLAARSEWVTHAFDHLKGLVNLQRDARSDALTMVVEPYLQYGTTDGMTVMWQTTQPGTSIVYFGETDQCEQSVSSDDADIHEVRIEGLEPATMYFYRVETTNDAGQKVASGVSTFATAVQPGTPFAYAVISDTQYNPVVSGKLSEHAWAQRPSFVLHSGDLVDTGTNDSHWTQHFFPGMQPLISRVPFYSVLGNHEQNASNYYEYVSVPAPEYYYEFRYGDAHFFMIDTNRNVGPDSEQYRWLEEKLASSDAKWKFASHHHPPYSSDEDDYGNLWKQNKSARGDLRARQLSPLYEKYGVDIVWTGHIHSYERTWPVKEEAAVAKDGPIYMVVGGGGGNLESPGPYRPFFQNQVRRTHHYVMVHINGPTLELRSYDLDDRLFDTVRIEKVE